MRQSVVPSFFLYGEPPRPVEDRFLHVERLDDRSRPSDWTIRPHAHANLSHVFCIETGAGIMRAESRVLPFAAPCCLIIPSGVIHGFTFDPDTTGSVLTIARPYLEDMFRREAELAPVLESTTCLALETNHRFLLSFANLAQELVWAAPGHRAAVDAILLTILVDALRLMHHAKATRAPLGPRALLVARFRKLIEERYRTHAGMDSYARELRVTMTQLRGACVQVAGTTPNEILHDRLLNEAKRVLLYSNMSITEAASYLGFEDPAYFSRFFSKSAGAPPRTFRLRYNGATPPGNPGRPS